MSGALSISPATILVPTVDQPSNFRYLGAPPPRSRTDALKENASVRSAGLLAGVGAPGAQNWPVRRGAPDRQRALIPNSGVV